MKHPHLILHGNKLGLFANPAEISRETGLPYSPMQKALKDEGMYRGPTGELVIVLPSKGWITGRTAQQHATIQRVESWADHVDAVVAEIERADAAGELDHLDGD